MGCAKPDEPADCQVWAGYEGIPQAGTPAMPTLSAERAHSGQFSVRVDQQNVYGHPVDLSWEQLGKPDQLRVKGWTWMPNLSTRAALVLTVVRPGQTAAIDWQSLNLRQVVRRPNQWVPVVKTFNLPAGLQPTDRVIIYLWQAFPGEAVFLDDLCLTKL